jgi:hypothetical protein
VAGRVRRKGIIIFDRQNHRRDPAVGYVGVLVLMRAIAIFQDFLLQEAARAANPASFIEATT